MFRKFTRRALTAILTFTVGVVVSLPWQKRHERAKPSRQAYSVCDALQTQSFKAQENVRLRGMLYGNADGSLVLNELDCKGQSAWIAVRLDEGLGEKGETLGFLNRMRRQSTPEIMARAEVFVQGRLTAQSVPGDSSAPLYTISVEELEPLTPISIISFVSN